MAGTSELLNGHDAEVAAWVGRLVPHAPCFDPCTAIGVVSQGRLIAGVVYHDYQREYRNIQISMAAVSPMWARRATIAGLLRYPFRQLGVWMVWTLTPDWNVKALKVNEHIGLKRKTIIPHAFGKKQHAVLSQMLEPAYRQYEALYG